MARSLRIALGIGGLCAALLAPAPTFAAETCDPTGPITLVILQSGGKVHALAKAQGGTVVRHDAETVVFADGRVITADVEGAGAHLNALGWGARPISVSAASAAKRARPRRARG
ncbi:MAG: hypothetical protein AAF430_15165 [Myxococcota bacterium]